MPVKGTGRIVELLQKSVQARLIAQGQNNVQAHGPSGRKVADGLCPSAHGGFTHVAREQGLWLRLGYDVDSQDHRDDR